MCWIWNHQYGSLPPWKKYLEAIQKFRTHTNLTAMHSCLGLINQVPYACATTNHVLSFQLLKPGITFEWINDQSVSILGKKKKGVCIFDHAKPIGLPLTCPSLNLTLAPPETFSVLRDWPICCPTWWKTINCMNLSIFISFLFTVWI